MLMAGRQMRCPESYIRDLKDNFGEAVIGPMTLKGDRGLFIIRESMTPIL